MGHGRFLANLWVVRMVMHAQSTCLPDGVQASQRKNLVNPTTGESYPLGLYLAGWAAAFANSAVARILVEEKLGYNVTQTGTGGATVDSFYALAGCLTPTVIGARGCGPTLTYSHASLEVWTEGYQQTWELLQNEYPATAPVNAGNIGYDGKASVYIPKSVSDAAWNGEGLNLDYYRGYNISWHDAAKYFDNPTMVNRSLLMPCNVTRLAITAPMARYAQITGDWGGVVNGTNGTVTGKCWGDFWWYSPSCRSNASTCILYFTGGNGWDLEGMMQRATAWRIPVGTATAKDYTLYTQLPLMYTCMFYWWVPDPTFLTLAPVEVTFPPHDRQASLKGDKRTASSTTSVDIAVSNDLRSLAPDVLNLFQGWDISIPDVNNMLLDRMETGDGWDAVACRWLHSNLDIWSRWLPDSTTCFAQFGLYNTVSEQFVFDRVDPSNLECRVCPSGSYSSELIDSGRTFICMPCAAGTAQPSGAALRCEPCGAGEYDDRVGSTGCKRCLISQYQDEKGQAQCKPCTGGTTTLGQGSISVEDCGCRPDSIDLRGGNVTCVPCSEGLACPFGATEANLLSGDSPIAGEDYVPLVAQGYYSTKTEPLSVFKCGTVVQCPGGKPGTCGGGLEGIPCAECPVGQSWGGSECEACTAWSIFLWVLSVVAIFAFLTCAYYLLTSQVTAKASVMATTGMSFGMTVNLLQSVGIIGMMTVNWPDHLSGILSAFQVLLLDIDNYSFACFAGPVTHWRYVVSVVFFFLGQVWLLANFAVSRLLPKKWNWAPEKTAATMGQFWQVGFSTMSTVAVAPLTCYTHPNGKQSLLKYPNIICGTENHATMLGFGLLLLVVGVLGFLALCTFAAWKMPEWSSSDRRHFVQSFRFLVFRFRLDSWWYGVPLLVRGPLLSLPIVLATDYPPMQTIFVNAILSAFLIVETLTWPWKVPLLNIMDMWMSLCLMLLVTGSALYLDQVEGVMAQFASTFSTAVMGGIGGAMVVMFTIAVSALVHRAAMGGATEFSAFNLGKVPSAQVVAPRLLAVAEELQKLDETWMEGKVAAMSAFDIRLITGCITLLAIDLLPHKAQELKFDYARVSAQSFAVRGKTQMNIFKKKQSETQVILEVADGEKEEEEEEAEEEEEVSDEHLGGESHVPEKTGAPDQQRFKSGWV